MLPLKTALVTVAEAVPDLLLDLLDSNSMENRESAQRLGRCNPCSHPQEGAFNTMRQLYGVGFPSLMLLVKFI